MITLTVVCRESTYPDVLIYTVKVRNPDDLNEVRDAITEERMRDLGAGDTTDIEPVFAFQGDLQPRADWRD